MTKYDRALWIVSIPSGLMDDTWCVLFHYQIIPVSHNCVLRNMLLLKKNITGWLVIKECYYKWWELSSRHVISMGGSTVSRRSCLKPQTAQNLGGKTLVDILAKNPPTQGTVKYRLVTNQGKNSAFRCPFRYFQSISVHFGPFRSISVHFGN